jgi:hypothetical protein
MPASRQNVGNWNCRFGNLSSFMADTRLVEPKKALSLNADKLGLLVWYGPASALLGGGMPRQVTTTGQAALPP